MTQHRRARRPAEAKEGIQIRGMSHRYGELLALDQVDLTVSQHGRVGIVGPSGCGKSTLLRLVAGLENPGEGHVTVLGQGDARGRLANCVLMPSKDLLLPWRTVSGNAGISLENHGVSRRRVKAEVKPLLERFGLAGFEDHWPSQLSSGMRQRVAFARTLVARKEVLLLDEPFGALDSLTRADLHEWLSRTLSNEPRTIILVTHDVEEALFLCQEVVVMSARPGRVSARIPVNIPVTASRREAVATETFIQLRARVMEALEK